VRADLKDGKVCLTLHEADKRVLEKAVHLFAVVALNAADAELKSEATKAGEAATKVFTILKAVEDGGGAA
jgi:hypothetical protein